MKKINYMVFGLVLLAGSGQLHGMLHRLSRLKRNVTKNFVRLCSSSPKLNRERIKQHLRSDIRLKKASIAEYLYQLKMTVDLRLKTNKNGNISFEVKLHDEDNRYIDQESDSVNNLATELALLHGLESSVKTIHDHFQLHHIFNEREKIKLRDFDKSTKDSSAQEAGKKELCDKLEAYFSGRQD